MPIEIVLVRHAICTGNAAERASCHGDHTLFTPEIRKKKSVEWPLLPLGVKQSEEVGNKIRQSISERFDYYITSDILRAVETAQHFGFKNVEWKTDMLWRERNWGGVENLPLPERQKVFNRLGIPHTEDSLGWRPPGGESMNSIVRRVESFLKWAQHHLSGKRLLIVSHGGPVQAMRVIQHNVAPQDYRLFISGDNYIRNCHVFRYSMRSYGDVNIPKFKLERSLFAKANGDWQDSTQELHNNK
jgi:broad specificity phosphatase PhoE